MLEKVSADGLDGLITKHETLTESFGGETPPEEANAVEGLRKIAQDRFDRVTTDELNGLEAIVLLKERPVVLVRRTVGTAVSKVDYDKLPDPWTHLNSGAPKKRVLGLLPSIGRIEVPNLPQYPFAGTGFVVGPDLVLTNKHVAKLFAEGLGNRGLIYRPGDAAISFRREIDTPEGTDEDYARVREVVMIHPYWDMAVLRMEGLPAAAKPLTLSVDAPEALTNREVVVIGYPAQDRRNDLDVQNRIFNRVFDVKRLQPGRLRERQKVQSFGNLVNALTHDSSTLGGNSGSAVIDLVTGQVVALHFAGEYLKANYAVPAYELARDSRVVACGLRFAGAVRATSDWAFAWDRLGGETAIREKEGDDDRTNLSTPGPNPSGPVPMAGGTVTWTIPIQVTIALGAPVPGEIASTTAATPEAQVEAMRMQVPVILDGLDEREGYRPDFLGLGEDVTIPLPTLTQYGEAAVARLDDGTWELKYHKFSVVMHKTRRLALFTAANSDWQPEHRLINGRKPSRKELTGLPDFVAEQWVIDPRIPGTNQLPDAFFSKDEGAFDKGHLVRRDDVCWGDTFEDIQMANGDTFHTTNCSPQVGAFNQSAKGQDNWGDLENLIQAETKAERAILFSGPVLAEDDQVFDGRDVHGRVRVLIPRSFWKIVVVAGEDGPEAFGFVMEQDLSAVPRPEEFAVPAKWKRFMRGIGAIEEMLGGLVKLTELKRYDRHDTEEGRRVAEAVSVR
ncbi:DNA/RNA non-specific endonuclease [Isosphaeraceae bacterium EP7]